MKRLLALLLWASALSAQTHPTFWASPSVIPLGAQNVTVTLNVSSGKSLDQYNNSWATTVNSSHAPNTVFSADGLTLVSYHVTDDSHATAIVNAPSTMPNTTGETVIQDHLSGNSFVVWVRPPFGSRYSFVPVGMSLAVPFQGVGTSWTSSSNFTVSGCSGVSITGKTLTSATEVSLTMASTAGMADCSATVTDVSTGNTTKVLFHTPQTYHVRGDGGIRYSQARTQYVSDDSGLACNGLVNAAYSGTGRNQPCAFNDLRWVWDDQTASGQQITAMQPGDTLILHGNNSDNTLYPTVDGVKQTGWRMGWDHKQANSGWCPGGNGPFYCNNGQMPSGIPGYPTRILGENYQSCHVGGTHTASQLSSTLGQPGLLGAGVDNEVVDGTADRSKMTQIFGGDGLYVTMQMGGAANIEFRCIEIANHENCFGGGLGANNTVPTEVPQCNHQTAPFSDTTSDGLDSDATTRNVLLVDMWIHGMQARGLKGPFGLGYYTLVRVSLSYNKGTGDDLDDGFNGKDNNNTVYSPKDNTIPNVTDDGTATYVSPKYSMLFSTVEWSSCGEQYPIPTGKVSWPTLCFGQDDQGQGDGVATANVNQEVDVNLYYSTLRYNIQEGEDFGHVFGIDPHIFRAIGMQAYGNQGSQMKNGGGFKDVLYADNLIVGNCGRTVEPFPDAPTYYSKYMDSGDRCRSGGDTISTNLNDTTTINFIHNTVLNSGNSAILWECQPQFGETSCTNSTLNIQSNIFRGEWSPANYNDPNTRGAPGAICGPDCAAQPTGLNIGTLIAKNNSFYGFRDCPAGATGSYNSNRAVNVVTSGETCDDPLFLGEKNVGTSKMAAESDLDNFVPTLASNSPEIGTGLAQSYITQDYTGSTWESQPSKGGLTRTSSATMPTGLAFAGYSYSGGTTTTPSNPAPPTTTPTVNGILHIFGIGLSGHIN